jgi:phage-related protein
VAGPIKISILADVGQAVKNVTKFSETVDENTHRVVTGLGDSKLSGGFGKMQEGFDVLDTRAMGFRDTVTGVQDSIAGFNALMGKGEHASDSMYDKLVLMGTGVGDLASGMANFLIPMAAIAQSMSVLSVASIRSTAALVGQKVALAASTVATGAMTAAQWLLNVALTANPIGLIILAIVALAAVLVIAWKKSDTFRAIVTGAFGAVTGAASATWGWIKGHWPLIKNIITNPIGTAVSFVIRHWDKIVAVARSIPGKIRAIFSSAGGWLKDAGRRVIDGFLSALTAGFDRVRGALGHLTGMLPSWKGPRSRDRKILAGPGALVIDGFIGAMESRYGAARKSLGGFTRGLTASAGAVGGSVAIAPGAAPEWARRLMALLDGGLTLTLDSSGSPSDDALLDLIHDRVRVKGGDGRVIGITRLS